MQFLRQVNKIAQANRDLQAFTTENANWATHLMRQHNNDFFFVCRFNYRDENALM